ncbi:oxysterol-binding protein-related protein 4C isoform X1 [Morus notabilis]|uniref:oxysterol-binding protein-related protein 4C isoform X1 n=2 Tax=Morus notabilis TaxID=981085 RepID=UPI000CED0B9D|nr:oxysterol-binding protein-related protein 4C isoform X1 [Morus notabilis]
MVMEGKKETQIFLTKPLSLKGDVNDEDGVPNMLQRVLSLFKNVRSGSDLTRMQLPAIFNIPKSQLQCYGESVYCVGDDMLGKCNIEGSPSERFMAVVAWSISTLRPVDFGVAPYNPILGETHHVSRGTLNVLLEQISHHPPVSVLHATDEKENLELLWCQHPVPKFFGTSVEAEIRGTRKLKLLNYGETYVMNSPKLSIKFFPVPGVEWTGNDRIRCYETGLEAKLSYGGRSFLGLRGNPGSIKGTIFESSSMKPLFEINGHWDRTVTVKDLTSGKVRVIYNSKEVISGLKTPMVKDPKGVWPSESALVWGEVSQGILNKDWGKAMEAKKAVEEKQRELLRDRNSRSETWAPKHFIVSYDKESGWDCLPMQNFVPPAPIVIPFNS